jgi:branched-chain amino acid transport system permease protein
MSRAYEVQTSTALSRVAARCAVLLLPIAVLMPWWAPASSKRLVVEFICYLVLAQMWNLLAGYGGLVSIGQQAFLGIGGYTLFALANHAGVDPFLCVPLGGVCAALLAVPSALLLFRLHAGYFAVATWVLAEIFRLVLSNTAFLGGGSGQSLTALIGTARELRESVTLWLALGLLLCMVLGTYALLKSRFGLALMAMRDSEMAAASQGVNVRGIKLGVYVLAALGSGLVGALYYSNALRIAPDAAFDVSWTAAIIFIVVIGGIGTLEGPLLGAILYFVLRELLADYGSWYLITLGTVAVLVMMRWPQGIWGLVQSRYGVHLFALQRRLHMAETLESGTSSTSTTENLHA